MSENEVVICNHCKAIYRVEPDLCDCVCGNEIQSYSKWKIVPELPTVAILNAAIRVKIQFGYDSMDEPIYTNLSEQEARDIYARILVAAS